MTRQLRITVGDETFDVSEHEREGARSLNFAWVGGPNDGYGFSTGRADDGPLTEAAAREAAQRFLSSVDRNTGDVAELADRYGTRRRPGFFAAIAITLVIVGLGFVVLGLTPAMIVALIGGMAASYAAVPYTVVAIVARERTARRGRARDEVEAAAGVESAYRSDVLAFGTFRQRASLVNAIVMLAVLIGALGVMQGWLQTDSGTRLVGALPLFGAFALAAGVFAMVVNAPAIYRVEVVRAERHAVRARAGAWRLILATAILTTVSWIGYCGFAVVFLTSMLS